MTDSLNSSYAESLRALDRKALHRLWVLLQDDAQDQRDRLMRDLIRMPQTEGTRLLGQLVAICDSDRAARLEVLRGIRDAMKDES